MVYFLYIFFGLAPSIIWLLFYLRKDVHPESNRMVLKIFFYGMLITLPVFLAELGFSGELTKLQLSPFITSVLYWFIGIALIEEVGKYLVVRYKVLNDPEFDEPVDAMLYMIIVALGFAALENILALFSNEISLSQTITTSILRFVGATFLHALCSGTVGYFLALSFFETKKRLRLIFIGLVIATILHSFFNISIIGNEASWIVYNNEPIITNFPLFVISLVSIITILITLAFFVSSSFKKVKEIRSICKIK